MNSYEEKVIKDLNEWHLKMSKKPSFASKIAKGVQNKMNNLFPVKVQNAITEIIKNMVKAVLVGSKFITKQQYPNLSLEEREVLVREKINFYKKAAATSGAGTGAGGFMLGLADFPILISLKLKFLFDVASIYGFDVKDYKERVYILYVFELAFSSDERRVEVYKQISQWDEYAKHLPEDVNAFDWETFQREYRDYIDLAKMLQLVPGIGAVVGAYANYQLMDKLGEVAINAYRLRVFANKKIV